MYRQGRGRPRRAIPIAPTPEAPSVQEGEHLPDLASASMVQPQPRPSGIAEPAGVNVNAEQLTQILAAAMRQSRENVEVAGCSIERVCKLGAKPFDGNGDPESALTWLDRVQKIYTVVGCTDAQRVMFSTFLLEGKAKDWWEAIERRHPDGVSWSEFQKEFTERFYPQSYKDARVEEFFRLEQGSLSVTAYEKRFSELVRHVPFIAESEEQKGKRFMVGLSPKLKIHLSLASQTQYGELVQAAVKVERNATEITQSVKAEQKHGAPASSSQRLVKKSKSRWTGGKRFSKGGSSS